MRVPVWRISRKALPPRSLLLRHSETAAFPRDPVPFASVAALMVAVALAARCIPARRATKVDPLVALRYQ